MFDCIAVSQNNIENHVNDAINDPENDLEITIIPRNKLELSKMIREIDEKPEKYTMDLRVSASENQTLQEGIPDSQRIDFIRDINFKQRTFKDKMARLREKEKTRQHNTIKSKTEKILKKRRIHHELVEERYNNSLNDIRRRERERKEAKHNYDEYMKMRNYAKPAYMKIRESYERDIVGAREADRARKLRDLRARNGSINFDNLKDHMKRYDAQKRINQFRTRENHGLDYVSTP